MSKNFDREILTRLIVLKFEGHVLVESAVIASSDVVLQELGDIDVDELVLLGNSQSMLLLLTARRSQQDDSLGSRRCLCRLKLEHTGDLFEDELLRLAGVELGDQTLADVLDSLHAAKEK